MNKYALHLIVIPEDRADEQLANGFEQHDKVKSDRIRAMPGVGGWQNVLKVFKDEYVQYLHAYPKGHVVMLIDFDGHYAHRRVEFENAIPDDLKRRTFVVGSKETPEKLKKEMANKSFERIGVSLAEDCHVGTETVWSHEHLIHNDPDRQRLLQNVKSFLF